MFTRLDTICNGQSVKPFRAYTTSTKRYEGMKTDRRMHGVKHVSDSDGGDKINNTRVLKQMREQMTYVVMN